jgi:hypothetical protein
MTRADKEFGACAGWTDIVALAAEDLDAISEGLREGQAVSRLLGAVPRSRDRGNATMHWNAHRRALETGAQYH